eukprot:3307901-Amphidinium_carterae.1
MEAVMATRHPVIASKTPGEASLVLAVVTIVFATMIDSQRVYTLYLSVVSQSVRTACVGEPATFGATTEAVASYYICWSTESLWTVRDMVLHGVLTTPQLSKLIYVCQIASKTNSSAERRTLDADINHVVNTLKLTSSPQTKNYVVGA